MKKSTIAILVIVGLVVLAAVAMVSRYNGLTAAQSAVEQGAANIGTQLQRRADLIPNLVQTVENFTAHESEVFAAVTQARQDMLDAKTVPEMAEANSGMNAALGSLVAVAEAYPELTSSTVYIGLMDELAGTENRIAVARKDYNDAVQKYNYSIRSFPGVLLARLFGFSQAPYFEASEGASAVPAVS